LRVKHQLAPWPTAKLEFSITNEAPESCTTEELLFGAMINLHVSFCYCFESLAAYKVQCWYFYHAWHKERQTHLE
jgi:hypothetical protein